MGLTSSLNEAEDALKAAILTQQAIPGSALAGVAVQLGHPGSGLLAEHIWIEEEATVAQNWSLTGGSSASRQRREVFRLQVKVFTSLSGNDYPTIRTRASGLSEELESALRADDTLTGASWHAQVVAIRRESAATDEGRQMLMTLDVECTQYLF